MADPTRTCVSCTKFQVDEIVMIAEDIMGKIFSCMGEKDDTVAKGLLVGKVRLVDVEAAISVVAARAFAATAAATAAAIAATAAATAAVL